MRLTDYTRSNLFLTYSKDLNTKNNTLGHSRFIQSLFRLQTSTVQSKSLQTFCLKGTPKKQGNIVSRLLKTPIFNVVPRTIFLHWGTTFLVLLT